MKWTKNSHNYVLDVDKKSECFISYVPAEIHFFSGTMFGADNNSDETALFYKGHYYVLNGDFRKEYESAFPSPDACLQVYLSLRDEHKSSWSEEWGLEEMTKDAN